MATNSKPKKHSLPVTQKTERQANRKRQTDWTVKSLYRRQGETEVNPHEQGFADRCLYVGPRDCRERLDRNKPRKEVCLNFQCFRCFPVCACNQRSIASPGGIKIVLDMLLYYDINIVPRGQMQRCTQEAPKSLLSLWQLQRPKHWHTDTHTQDMWFSLGKDRPWKQCQCAAEEQHSAHIEAVTLLLFCSPSFPRNSRLTSFPQHFPSDLCHCPPIVFFAFTEEHMQAGTRILYIASADT